MTYTIGYVHLYSVDLIHTYLLQWLPPQQWLTPSSRRIITCCISFRENLLVQDSVSVWNIFIFLYVGRSVCCVCNYRFSVIFQHFQILFYFSISIMFVEVTSSSDSWSCYFGSSDLLLLLLPCCLWNGLFLFGFISVTMLWLCALYCLYLVFNELFFWGEIFIGLCYTQSNICVKQDWVWIWEMC